MKKFIFFVLVTLFILGGVLVYSILSPNPPQPHYPEDIRKDYMTGCLTKGNPLSNPDKSLEPFCSCTLEQTEQSLPLYWFLEESKKSASDSSRPLPDQLKNAMAICQHLKK